MRDDQAEHGGLRGKRKGEGGGELETTHRGYSC